jgi:hypothetical protein
MPVSQMHSSFLAKVGCKCGYADTDIDARSTPVLHPSNHKMRSKARTRAALAASQVGNVRLPASGRNMITGKGKKTSCQTRQKI